MLCSKCNQICKLIAKDCTPCDALEADTCGLGLPSSYKSTLYDTFDEFKASEHILCSICRSIWNCVDDREWPLIQDCCAVLQFQLDRGTPILRVLFQSRVDETTSLTKLIAIYHGDISSKELRDTLRRCTGKNNDSTGSESSFQLASYWLNECLNGHPVCPKRSFTFLPTRVIDVGWSDGSQPPKLCETTAWELPKEERRFVALSHCWGKERIIVTTKNSIEDHKKGITMEALSRTFQDAVTATRSLGLRYLWIDSLCIIQDSKEDWQKESIQMCKIYRESFVTISAAHASGGMMGCFVKRDGIAKLPFELPVNGTCKTHHQQNLKPPIFLVPMSRPRQSFVRGDTIYPLYGRAWVLQEQLLPTRTLIYDQDQIRWECLSIHGSEQSPIKGGTRLKQSLKEVSRSLPASLSEPAADFFAFDKEGKHPLDPHSSWCEIITEFTHRGITSSSDRLIAVAGIADAIQQRTVNQYLAGVWRDNLAVGLLWRIPYESAPGLDVYFTPQTSTRQAEPVAPSWSWAAVTLPTTYEYTYEAGWSMAQLQSIYELVDIQVTGFPASQSGSLTVHGQVREVCIRGSKHPVFLATCEGEDTSPESKGRKSRQVQEHWNNHVFYTNAAADIDHGTSSSTGDTNLNEVKVPGLWYPDEPLSEDTTVTFLAIGETTMPGDALKRFHDEKSYRVFTLGLLPTNNPNKPNEYRRVGLAEWHHCSCYGYYCKPKHLDTDPTNPNEPDEVEIAKRNKQTPGSKFTAMLGRARRGFEDSWSLGRGSLAKVAMPGGGEFVSDLVKGKGRHDHVNGRCGEFHERVRHKTRTITIV